MVALSIINRRTIAFVIKNMIKLFEPYVSDEARANVQRVLTGKQIAQGPEVDLFEQEFAMQFGFEPWQIVTVNSGTSALELAYDLVGIRVDEAGYSRAEVITPVLTCTATNIPLVRRNANIVFADIDGRDSLNMDPEDVNYKINEDTKAVVFVHFGGSSEGLDKIEDICDSHDVDLICDAAQALGSELSKRARFSTISLQAIKSLTAGDGGILICRDKADADMARKLRWYGYDREAKQRLGDTDLELAGYKMHMNDINAAIARGNLAVWSRIFDHRQSINDVYWKYGEGKGLVPGIWNPIVLDMNFEAAKDKLTAAGLDVEIGQYHFPNSKYSIFRFAQNECPKMDRAKDYYFLLPCHMGVTLEQANAIGKALWE